MSAPRRPCRRVQREGAPPAKPLCSRKSLELVEQPLEIHRVGELGVVLGVGGEAHRGDPGAGDDVRVYY